MGLISDELREIAERAGPVGVAILVAAERETLKLLKPEHPAYLAALLHHVELNVLALRGACVASPELEESCSTAARHNLLEWKPATSFG